MYGIFPCFHSLQPIQVHLNPPHPPLHLPLHLPPTPSTSSKLPPTWVLVTALSSPSQSLQQFTLPSPHILYLTVCLHHPCPFQGFPKAQPYFPLNPFPPIPPSATLPKMASTNIFIDQNSLPRICFCFQPLIHEAL